MNKISPAGLGLWVAFERAIDPGDKFADIRVALGRCKAAGAKWIAPRAGAGGANDGAFDETSVASYLAAGLSVYPWIFPYVGTESKLIAGFRRFFVAGAHGAIVNAEFEYQKATAQDAEKLVAGIRTAWAEAMGERTRRGLPVTADEPFIAHAPPDYLGAGVGHALSDELVKLDELCDAIMPQVYAFEHDDRGHDYHVKRVMAGYAKRGLFADKVWCVGCTYRPKQRGGKLTPVIENEPKRVADDVAAFLDNAYVRACPAPSLYSLDAITWINGPSDMVMRTLAERIRPDDEPDTIPSTPGSKSSQNMRAVDPGTAADDWRPLTDAHTALPCIVPPPNDEESK
jgi:hypothetical protein